MKTIILPKDIEAEADLLGCYLLKGLAPALPLEAFYHRVHFLIAKTLSNLKESSEVISVETVVNKLKKKVPVSYVIKLLDRVAAPTPEIINYYERRVANFYSLRLLTQTCAKVISEAHLDDADPIELATYLQKIAYDIETPKDNAINISRVIPELLNDILQKVENPTSPGIQTGLYDIDKALCGLMEGDLIIIAARPSFGKTALALNIAQTAAKADHKVLIISCEMTIKQLLTRFLVQSTGIPYHLVMGGRLTKHQCNLLSQAASLFAKLPIQIVDSSGISDIETERIIAKHKPDLVIVDYLQLMTAKGNFTNRECEISYLSRSLKAIAKRYSIPVLVLSQLNREASKNKRRPQLHDLRESGAIEQDADVVLFIHKPSSDATTVELIVSKNRNGPCGIVEVLWDKEKMEFKNLFKG